MEDHLLKAAKTRALKEANIAEEGKEWEGEYPLQTMVDDAYMPMIRETCSAVPSSVHRLVPGADNADDEQGPNTASERRHVPSETAVTAMRCCAGIIPPSCACTLPVIAEKLMCCRAEAQGNV